MAYMLQGVDPRPFRELYGLDDLALRARGARRYVVDEENSFPDRVSLSDLPIGARALLVNHEHLPHQGPYRSRHAIFVEEGALSPARFEDQVPDSLARRLLSVRSFDADFMMLGAEVLEGSALDAWIREAFSDPAVHCLHVHTARRGCFLAAIERA